jgi:hypothetical protein
MQFRYSQLFSVTFLHDYYVSGKTPDLMASPTPATKALMAQHHLRWAPNRRHDATAFSVAIRTTSAGEAFTPLPEETKLSFWLSLRDAQFLNFTDQEAKSPGHIWYFRNEEAPDNSLNSLGDFVPVQPVPFLFHYDLSGTTEPIVEITEADSGASAGEALVEQISTNLWRVTIDLSAHREGRYQLSHNSAHLPANRFIYASEAGSAPGTFAVLDIVKGAAGWDLPLSTARAFTLPFTRRTSIWKYFVVRKGTSPYALTDQATGAVAPYPWPIHFVPYDSVGYTPTAEDEATLAYLESFYPAGTVVDFLVTADAASGGSPLELPHYELPRRSIALVDTDSVGSVTMRRHVAVPGIHHHRAEVILCLETQQSL